MDTTRRGSAADAQAPSQTLSLRLRSAVDESRLTIGMAFVLVLLSCALLWDSVDHWHLGAWGLGLGLLYSARLGFNIAYHRRVVRPGPMDHRRWAALLYLQLGVTGLAWGLLYWLVAQIGVELRLTGAALLMAVAGVSLGALFTLPLGYALFSAGLLLPPAASLLLFERSPNFLLAMTLIGYWVAMVLLARRSSGVFAQRALAQMAQSRALTLHQALLTLRQRDFTDLAGLLHAATETAARALSAQRVGVWRVEPMQAALTCADLFRADANVHERGARIVASLHPGYFAALGKGELMAAGDSSADPRSSDFLEDSASLAGKAARLDAPLCLGARLEGMLRVERIGTPYGWSQEEQDFVLALASHLMHAIDQDARLLADARFRDFSLASADMFWEADAKGHIVWVSESTMRILGVAADSLPGLRIQDIARLERDEGGNILAAYLAAWRSRTVFRGLRFQINGSSGQWISVSGAPWAAAAGNFIGYRGCASDVTQQVEADSALRESRRRVAELVAHLPGEAYRCRNDPGWTLEFASQGILALTGHPPEDFVGGGLAFGELIHPQDRDRVWSEIQQALQQHEPFALEYRIHGADGAEKWVLERGAGVYREDGTVEAIEGFIIDNTEFKRASEALQELNLRLEQHVEQRTAQLHASELHLRASFTELSLAKEQIEQANQALEQRVAARTAELSLAMREMEAFSYSISHDLRSPVRAMAGFSSILLDQHGGALPEGARALAQRIGKASLRMGAMIDGLLELARVSGARLRRQPIDLARLAKEEWAELAEADPACAATYSAPGSCMAEGDPVLLRNVLQNLLGNAFKYSRGTAQARVEFGTAQEGGESVFFVRDNGAGFDMAHAAKLFDMFQRLHSAKEFEGLGVGLATVRRIVERHGGRIWAESSPGQGACFKFTLTAPAPG